MIPTGIITDLIYVDGGPAGTFYGGTNKIVQKSLSNPLNYDPISICEKLYWPVRPDAIDPYAVAVSGNYLYLFSNLDKVIYKYSLPSLNLVSSLSISISIYGLGSDESYLYVPDYNGTLFQYNLNDLTLNNSASGFTAPEDVCSDGTYIYMTDYSDSKIYKLLVSDLSIFSSIGSLGSDDDNFNYPEGICVDNTGTYIYICDTGNHRIVKRLCSDLSYVSQYSSADLVNSYYYGIAIDNDDQFIYVADNGTNRVEKINTSDMTLNSAIITFNGADSFSGLQDIAVYGDNLFIADEGNRRIVQLNKSSFAYVNEFNTTNIPSTIPATLQLIDNVTGITSESSHLYVAMNHATQGSFITKQSFDSNRKVGYLAVTDRHVVTAGNAVGYSNNQFDDIRSIDTDGTYLYVCDFNNNRVMKLNCSNLSYVAKFVFSTRPICVTSDDGNYIYVLLERASSQQMIHKCLKSSMQSVLSIDLLALLENSNLEIDAITYSNGEIYLSSSIIPI